MELIPVYDSQKSFYGRATTEKGKDGYYLYSYNVKVFFIPYDDGNNNDEVNEMKLLWRGYSATTSRHIREFIRQYATDWQKRNISDKITKKEIESLYKGRK